MYKTANLRKPEAVATRITVRSVRAANYNRRADYLAEEFKAKLEDPEWFTMVDEALKAYVLGVAAAARIAEGAERKLEAVAIQFYVARRDAELGLTRSQTYFLYYWAFAGAGFTANAERAERIYKNPFFED